MKRILALILALVMTMALVACGGLPANRSCQNGSLRAQMIKRPLSL